MTDWMQDLVLEEYDADSVINNQIKEFTKDKKVSGRGCACAVRETRRLACLRAYMRCRVNVSLA